MKCKNCCRGIVGERVGLGYIGKRCDCCYGNYEYCPNCSKIDHIDPDDVPGEAEVEE